MITADVMNSENKEYHSSNDTEKYRYIFFHSADLSTFLPETVFALY